MTARTAVLFVISFVLYLHRGWSQPVKKDSLSCVIHFESVKVLKRLSDEYFIAKKDSIAKEGYRKALLKLGFLESNINCPEISDSIALYQLDILYRIYLIDEKIDFWGFSQFAPLNPVYYYDLFIRTYNNFEELAKEIEKLIKDIDKTQGVINVQTNVQDFDQVNEQIERVNNEKADLNEDYYNNSIELYKQRIDRINNRHKEIETEANQKLEELKQVSASLNNVMLQGLSQAIGLPINLQSINLQASLKDNLFSVGKDLLLNNPEMQKAIGDLNKQMSGLVSLYYKVDSVRQKAKTILEAADKVHKMIKDPTLDNLMKLGGNILQSVNANDYETIKKAFDQVKSIQTLFHAAEKYKKIKRKIVEEVFSNKAMLQVYIDNIIQYKEVQQRMFQGLIRQYNSVSSETVKKFIVNEFIRLFPDELWNTFSATIKSEIKLALNLPDEKQVKERLKQYEFVANKGIEWANSQLKVRNVIITTQPDTLLAFLWHKGDGLAAKHKAEVTAFLNSVITNKVEELSNLIKEELDMFDLENTLSAAFKDLDKDQLEKLRGEIYDKLYASISAIPDLKNIEKDILSTELGSFFLNNNQTNAPQLPYEPTVKTKNLSESEQWQRAIISGAISYAFPYLGMAMAVFEAFSKRNRIIDEIERLKNEYDDLTVKKIHMIDMLDQSYLQLRLTQKERQINDLRKDYAVRSYYRIRAGIHSRIDQLHEERMKVSMRKPLLYFLAERLREHARMLDKALMYRHNISISSLVLKNVSNFRYILDDDIRLATWLDLSKDGVRSDLEYIRSVWRNYKALIEQYCPMCLTTSIPRLDCRETQSISLKSQFPDEWHQLQQAIANEKNEYQFHISLLPGGSGEILNDSLNSIRFLDARLIAVEKNDHFFKISNVKLTHPGIAYVFNGEKYEKEIFQARALNGVAAGKEFMPGKKRIDYPEIFDYEEYRKKWQTQAANKFDEHLVGYGMFCDWTFTIPITAATKKADDILARFIYSFKPVVTEPVKGNFEMVLNSQQNALKYLSGSSFKAFNGPGEFNKRINYLITKYESLWKGKNSTFPETNSK